MSTGKLEVSQIVGYSQSFYERCFQNCFPNPEGFVSAKETADLLRKSGLDDVLLSKIWNLSDVTCRGKLNYYEFCVALKLVALAQSGLEVKLENIQMQCQTPRLLSHNQMGSDSPSMSNWSVSPEDQAKFSKLFDNLNPGINQKLSGDAVKSVLLKYGLPTPILGRIWSVADIDSDGYLDREEFILAMHLTQRANSGQEPPLTLPRALMPPSKRVGTLNTHDSPRNSPLGGATVSTSSNSVPWIVNKLEKEQYDGLFYAADTQGKGFVNGLEVKDIFVQSGLPQSDLAQIWNLCDINRSGQLNSEQFALAMHLVNQQIKCAGSRPIPSSLTLELTPPSFRNMPGSNMRSGGNSMAQLPNSRNSSTIDLHRQSPLSLNSFGIKPESDEVYKEIESLQKERNQVEQTCRQLESDLRNQRNDVQQLQETLEKSQQTCRTLSLQKEEAQQRLNELNETKKRTEAELTEVREKCAQEREELTKLRDKIGKEVATEEKRRGELKSAQAELEKLLSQEKSLSQQAIEARKKLEHLEEESRKVESDLAQAEKQNKHLEKVRQKLEEFLDAYESAMKDLENKENIIPNSEEVDQYLSTDVQLEAKYSDNEENKFDAFGSSSQSLKFSTKTAPVFNDPFSALPDTNVDPFSLNDPFATDPFSNCQTTTGITTNHEDPFSQDPFSANISVTNKSNGWDTNNPTSTTVNNDAAFSIGNVDDLFKNMPAFNISDNKQASTVNSSGFDAWGELSTGSSTQKQVFDDPKPNNSLTNAFDDPFPFDNVSNNNLSNNTTASYASQPPPRPSKAPTAGKTSKKSGGTGTDKAGSFTYTETDQLTWARNESVREAKAAEEAAKREQADLELAIKLSKQEMKSSRKK